MDYISTAQAAEKWGITANRVFKLVSKGRIPGAVKIGPMWMIPKDAEKPVDGRTKAGKSNATAREDFFRFPSFEHRNINSFNPPLSEEELQMKAAFEAFHACRFEDADKILAELPESTKNKYHRIGALHVGCMIDISLCNTERFFTRYIRLVDELSGDFPHKREMQECLNSIDACLCIGKYYDSVFDVDPTYDYHSSFLPRLAALRALTLTYPSRNATISEMHSIELSCLQLKQLDVPCELQAMHVYLGVGYVLAGQKEAASRHLHAALQLAEQYELFFFLAMHYYYFKEAFSQAMEGFPKDLKDRIEFFSTDYYERFRVFMDSVSMERFFFSLKRREHILLYYAVQGYTNKEIASFLQVSTGTIGKRYSEIYQVLGVESKKELVEICSASDGSTMLDVAEQATRGIEKKQDK